MEKLFKNSNQFICLVLKINQYQCNLKEAFTYFKRTINILQKLIWNQKTLMGSSPQR